MNTQPSNSTDPILAGFLLGAIANGCDVEKVVDVAKMFTSKNDGPPTQDAIDFITPRIGKVCKMIGSVREGIVVGVNMSTGMYCGSRYPLKVKITSCHMANAVGQTFEYDLSQWEIAE